LRITEDLPDDDDDEEEEDEDALRHRNMQKVLDTIKY